MTIKVLTNAKIYLFDQSHRCVDSLAIQDDRVLAAGSHDEVIHLSQNDSEVIDLDGNCVIPGMIDAHVHIKSLALQESMVECETDTLDECLQRIKKRVETTLSGNWILGRGWNQNLWERFGNADDLDDISQNHPIYLAAKSSHAAWVNSHALSLANIDRSTPDPDGGVIQRDEHGLPTGILFENAMKLVSKLIPAPSSNDLIEYIQRTHNRLWRCGITGYHDFDGPSAFEALQIMQRTDCLGMRVVKNIPLNQMENAIELGLQTGFGNPSLKIGNIKIFADGALGPQTAAMVDPYQGNPEEYGILLFEADDLAEIIAHAEDNNFGVSVHAIGDQGNRVVLDAFQHVQANRSSSGSSHLRHRIEHLQLLHPNDIRRPAALELISSMQPIHATSDMHMVDRHWGQDRAKYSYAWRTILDSGGKLIFGSDAPIEDPNPFLGLHAAVTRRRADGSPGADGWVPEQKISLLEALIAYTKTPAYAAGLESQLGSLCPGYFADLVVLSLNPFECPPQDLHRISPLGTMVGGEWKFRTI